MQIRKYRWSRHYESAEEELFSFLAAKNIQAERWELAAGESSQPAPHASDIQLFCAEGSLTITIGAKARSFQPGDGLDIPANTTYSLVAGMTGVVCYESRQPVSHS